MLASPVDMSACNFKSRPIVNAVVESSSYTGQMEQICSVRADSFSFKVTVTDITDSYEANRYWKISWMATGYTC